MQDSDITFFKTYRSGRGIGSGFRLGSTTMAIDLRWNPHQSVCAAGPFAASYAWNGLSLMKKKNINLRRAPFFHTSS